MPIFEKIKKRRALKKEAKEKYPGYKVRVTTNVPGRNKKMKDKGWTAAAKTSIEKSGDKTFAEKGRIKKGETLARATAWVKPKKRGRATSYRNVRSL